MKIQKIIFSHHNTLKKSLKHMLALLFLFMQLITHNYKTLNQSYKTSLLSKVKKGKQEQAKVFKSNNFKR
jgi:hypothetical protein